jgi:hypothetical protein
VKDWWMKNGEIFDTDACGKLVVNNSVEDGSDDASGCDFKGFHRVVGLDQILTVVTSPLHSRWFQLEVLNFLSPIEALGIESARAKSADR